MRSARRLYVLSLILLVLVQIGHAQDQAANRAVPPPPHAKQIHLKHVLVIAQTKGFEHDSIPAAMAAVIARRGCSMVWPRERKP